MEAIERRFVTDAICTTVACDSVDVVDLDRVILAESDPERG